ncbi:AAEL005394-PA [Aedes aegypti]|uniref:AAEL005394-PA n=1 Tax=Aedes aegypti TaxID=7159 RepID=Q17A71_AEDAE|nr:AAEL005394-PA [Aedes aegypti]
MADQYSGYGAPQDFGGPMQFSVPPPSLSSANFSQPLPMGGGGGGGGSAGGYNAPPPSVGGYGNQSQSSAGGGYGGNQSGGYSSGAGNKGSYNNKADSGEMVTQEDTIFIQGMNTETTKEEITERFGSIGVIKKDKRTMKPKLWMYKDKETGNMKGEATVTYEDTNAAQSGWFDNKEFKESVVKVSLAQRYNTWQNKGGSRGCTQSLLKTITLM